MTATQFAHASYQEIIDLKTVNDNVSVVGIHTPTSTKPYQFMRGFFDQFKKYKYNGCSMALVPAARLPSDISQVGYEGGEQPIDARDILNPVLFHGCHGNALGPILDQFLNGPGNESSFGGVQSTPSTEVTRSGFGDGAAFGTVYEKLYYRALTDNTWLKANPQAGFRKSGLHPMVYNVSTNHAIGNGSRPSSFINPQVVGGTHGIPSSYGMMGIDSEGSGLMEKELIGHYDIDDDRKELQLKENTVGVNFFTSKLSRLGWLDTTLRLSHIPYWTGSFAGLAPTDNDLDQMVQSTAEQLNQLPLLYMGLILLPPAYKANQYMRLILNHSFSFKGFRGCSTNNDPTYLASLAGGPNTAGGYYDRINQ